MDDRGDSGWNICLGFEYARRRAARRSDRVFLDLLNAMKLMT